MMGQHETSVNEKYICRCEEITEGEIREAIRSGARTVAEVKRWTRAGMGICQGRSCRRLVERILCQELGIKPEDLELSSFRQPVRSVSLASMEKFGEARGAGKEGR